MIIPYVEIDGTRTLSDEILKNIWGLMVVQNLYKKVFYDGGVTDAASFIKWLKRPTNFVVTQWDGDNPVSVCWLNDTDKNSGKGHFCFFKDYWGQSAEYGKEVLRYWFGFEQDGNPILDVVIGFTPENNRLALRLVNNLGGVSIGTIPYILYDIYHNKKIGAVVSYIERKHYE